MSNLQVVLNGYLEVKGYMQCTESRRYSGSVGVKQFRF